jgi:hypothetical protein
MSFTEQEMLIASKYTVSYITGATNEEGDVNCIEVHGLKQDGSNAQNNFEAHGLILIRCHVLSIQ